MVKNGRGAPLRVRGTAIVQGHTSWTRADAIGESAATGRDATMTEEPWAT